MKKNMNRREFIYGSSLMAVSASLYLCGCSGGSGSKTPGSLPSSAVPSTALQNKNRAMVYLILGGGNDSYNMLVPTDESSYNDYRVSRSNLALERSELLELNGFTDSNGKTFGLHPSMSEVQKLFNGKKLSFIANVGPLVEPTTKKDFVDNKANLPLGLMSHADQFRHWQTSIPDQRVNKGWFGKLADQIQPNRKKEQISMNISLGGTNILQLGDEAREYSITKNGSTGLIINEQKSELDRELFKSFNTVLNRKYDDIFEKTYMDTTIEAQTQHEIFRDATEKVDIKTSFSDSELSQQFKMVAKSISAANNLNMPKQTFFLHYYGWDHHDELLDNHSRMLGVVSKALSEFDASLEELGLEDNVITFTGSDFGRSLTSNGNGTDHGWGGNVMVMGKDIDGAKVFGEYPDLKLDSDLDIGGGVLIPTTSTDEMFFELAVWFGANSNKIKTILPNIDNFYGNDEKKSRLGFIV